MFSREDSGQLHEKKSQEGWPEREIITPYVNIPFFCSMQSPVVHSPRTLSCCPHQVCQQAPPSEANPHSMWSNLMVTWRTGAGDGLLLPAIGNRTQGQQQGMSSGSSHPEEPFLWSLYQKGQETVTDAKEKHISCAQEVWCFQLSLQAFYNVQFGGCFE